MAATRDKNHVRIKQGTLPASGIGWDSNPEPLDRLHFFSNVNVIKIRTIKNTTRKKLIYWCNCKFVIRRKVREMAKQEF